MAIAASSRLMVSTVRVSNFRALRNIELKLNELTILVGANNVGKTTFLDALHAAIGAVRRPLGKEDIYIAAEETDVPKDRKAVIDVLIRPFMEDGTPAESFPAASFWTNLWGDGISQDEDTGYSDFVGIRTTIAWSAIHGEHRTERCFLKEWRPFDSWLEAEEKGKVSAVQVEPIALHYIDAQRDLEEDLKARSSFWRRLTDELGLADEDIAAFESVLTDLNRRIVDGSEVLKHIRNNLGGLGKVVADKHAAVDISPVARRLRDLSKGVDVAFSTGQCQSFPLTRHGMGTRSLASLMVFRAFASWRQELARIIHGEGMSERRARCKPLRACMILVLKQDRHVATEFHARHERSYRVSAWLVTCRGQANTRRV